jgi:O-acetyl-ADP-ribose deacetylase (regulator of RNase III)
MMMERMIPNNVLFKIVEGDITDLDVDAIVNPANVDLILGGGVAGAIRMKGGPAIQQEASKLAPIETGEAIITTGGNLKARYVIHAAGPIYEEYTRSKAAMLLENAVLNSLAYFGQDDINSIALPAISAGIYGYPAKECAKVIISSIIEFIAERTQEKQIEIILCLFGNNMFNLFLSEFKQQAEVLTLG